MEICNKESSMSSFNEFRSLVFIHFKSLAPLSGQALVTDRLWATADNFTRFGNITLSNEMLHILCNKLEVFLLRLEGFNFHLICGAKVVCKCGYMVQLLKSVASFAGRHCNERLKWLEQVARKGILLICSLSTLPCKL